MNFNSLTEVYSNYQKAVSDFVSRADKYESAYKKIDNDYNIRLSELNKEKESALILLKTAFEQQKDGFELERTKLSAEIRRYHYFFENGTIGKLTPAISNNIQNLNRSVNEFINIKIDTITKQHQEKIKNEENRFHKLFFDLQTNFGIERER
jgi:hypothetical protein